MPITSPRTVVRESSTASPGATSRCSRESTADGPAPHATLLLACGPGCIQLNRYGEPPTCYRNPVTSGRQVHYTYAEYLSALEVSEIRLEDLDGEMFAMAGGTPEHGMVAARMIQQLGAILPASCRVMTSDIRIRILASGLSTFPDVSVVCGDLQRAPGDAQAVVNPVLVVEVLSPSTSDNDADDQLRHYQQLASVPFVVLVEPAAPKVTAVTRTPDGWQTTEHTDTVGLAELGTLSVATLHD